LRVSGLAFALVSIALAALYLDLPGIYNDEALFGNAVFPPFRAMYSARAFGHDVPLMLLSYLGTVKSHLYRAVFAAFPVDPWTIRLPTILVGGASVALLHSAVRRVAGARTAFLTALLLATDATWIVTTRLDWGPVALQHFFLILGVWAIVRFAESERRRWLALGFVSFGLGCWDKALFVAPLAGVSIAGLLFWPGWRRYLTARNLATAALAFALGAYPLIRYNVSRGGVTFRTESQWSVGDLPGKANGLLGALEGRALLGWATSPDADEDYRRGGLPWLLVGCGVAGAFFARRSRVAGFALTAFAIAWALLISNRDTGASAHHVVLLWPLPHLFAGAVLAALPWTRLATAAAVLVAASNLAVLSQHYSQWRRVGGGHGWSDAVYSLARFPADRLMLVDWGIGENLHLLRRGRVELRHVDDGTIARGDAAALLEEIFVGHAPGYEFFPGFVPRLDAFAAARGFRRIPLTTIPDSRGRPIYLIFRYSR